MKEHYLDLNYLNELSGGENAFTIDILETFIVNTPDILNEMQQAYESKDWDLLNKSAHKGKSSFQFVGSKIMYEAAYKIEILCAKPDEVDANEVLPLLEKVKDAYYITKEYIEEELIQLRG